MNKTVTQDMVHVIISKIDKLYTVGHFFFWNIIFIARSKAMNRKISF